MGDPIDVSDFGKLSAAPDASAPLLVVFGGIDVHGIQSGVYMWNYMSKIKDRFHIFAARSNTVSGSQAHSALMSTLKAQGLTASDQILYLFSDGQAAIRHARHERQDPHSLRCGAHPCPEHEKNEGKLALAGDHRLCILRLPPRRDRRGTDSGS